MTDYTKSAAEMAAVVGTCAAGLATGAAKGAITGIVSGAAFAEATLIAYAPNTAAAAAAVATAEETAAVVPEAVLFTAAMVGTAGAMVGAAKGCHDNVEHYFKQQVIDQVAKTAAAQTQMTTAEKLLAIETAAKHVSTPDKSLDLER